MLDVLIDALIDTIKLIPFLFVTYIFMEWLEHRTGNKTKGIIKNAGKLGPLFGGILGALPQCGFSTAASNLYAGKVVSAGTLIAVFLSTSDEMLPIMFSQNVPVKKMFIIVFIKIVIGVLAGFMVDFIIRGKRKLKKIEISGIHQVCEHDNCHCEKGIFKSSVKHTLVTTFFVFVVVLLLNAFIYLIGEDAIAAVVMDRPILGPLICGLVGLIPNCAASVVITELYLQELISFGTMMAGLLAGAGVGILVLFRVNENIRNSIKITATVYGIGVVFGIVVDMITKIGII